MATLSPHKSGDTFALIVNLAVDVLITELRSEVREGDGSLVGTFVITATGTPGQFIFTVLDTISWTSMVYMDIRRTVGGVILTSETIEIPVVRSITI